MPTYRLVIYASESSSPEFASVERDRLGVDDIVENVPGYEDHRLRVVCEHIPSDSDEPEPNAFDCKLIV